MILKGLQLPFTAVRSFTQSLISISHSHGNNLSFTPFHNNLTRFAFSSLSTSHPSPQYVASIDQSTTSTKFTLFQANGKLIDKEIILHEQITPQQGWLQHNPMQILANTHTAMERVLNRLKESTHKSHKRFSIERILGLGICNQRETIICWNNEGIPLYNGIVWCDTRTNKICEDFKRRYGDFKMITGLPVSPYFSLFKILWLIENVPEIKQGVQSGGIRFGTIDSWLVYNLMGGAKYVTDASNASRTYLCNLNGEWDDSLLKLFKLKKQLLPEIVSSFETVGEVSEGPMKGVKISSILGDQQSSAYAHGLEPNQMKITYGTGCFLLSNNGHEPEIHDEFITTILNKDKENFEYAYEASVQCGGGTLNWAHRTGFFTKYEELNGLPYLTHEELMFFPSFGSVFAPFWKSGVNVKGAFIGLSFNITRQQILQAILESITFRLLDNIRHKEFNDVKEIFVDGGMTQNETFMQLQADTFNKIVKVKELDTCWGVAKGCIKAQNVDLKAIGYEEGHEEKSITYEPNAERCKQIQERYGKWCKVREHLYGWESENETGYNNSSSNSGGDIKKKE